MTIQNNATSSTLLGTSDISSTVNNNVNNKEENKSTLFDELIAHPKLEPISSQEKTQQLLAEMSMIDSKKKVQNVVAFADDKDKEKDKVNVEKSDQNQGILKSLSASSNSGENKTLGLNAASTHDKLSLMKEFLSV